MMSNCHKGTVEMLYTIPNIFMNQCEARSCAIFSMVLASSHSLHTCLESVFYEYVGN